MRAEIVGDAAGLPAVGRVVRHGGRQPELFGRVIGVQRAPARTDRTGAARERRGNVAVDFERGVAAVTMAGDRHGTGSFRAYCSRKRTRRGRGPPPHSAATVRPAVLRLTGSAADTTPPPVTISFLEFEKPVATISARAAEYRAAGDEAGARHAEGAARRALAETYARLTPWQKTQVARHPQRPHFVDFVKALVEDFTPLAGDRAFGEDHAIIGGIGRLRGAAGAPVVVIGQEKGHDTATRVKHNFGMGRPEGYRKAIRLVELAGRFNLPVVTLIDSAGAYPGIDGEERGQAEAIARSTEAFLAAPVPIIAAITGEGMSGGAIALAAANRVLMFEHAVYAVISPEGCASILWRTAEGETNKPGEAAESMRVTAADCKRFGIVDAIVPEPLGGAHRDPVAAIAALTAAIGHELAPLLDQPAVALRKARRDKFIEMGRAL